MILGFDGHLRYLRCIDNDLIKPYAKFSVLKSSEGGLNTLSYGLIDQITKGNSAGIAQSIFHWYSPAVTVLEQLEQIVEVVLLAKGQIKMIWIDVEQYGSDYLNNLPYFSGQVISSGVRSLIDFLILKLGLPVGVYWNPYFILTYAPEMLDWLFDGSVYNWVSSYITDTVKDLEWRDLRIPTSVNIQWPQGWPADKRQVDVWQWIGDRYKLPGIYKDSACTIRTPVELDLLITERIKTVYGLKEMNMEMKLLYPVDEGKFAISQHFGEDPAHYTISKGHNGVDFATPVGSNVYAMKSGKVLISELRKEKIGYGGQVRIQHPEGTTIYGHLSKTLVNVGDDVVAGQLIGLTGGAVDSPYSGMSTGPHLHAELRLNTLAPQVPGGYVYNAINIEPLFISKTQKAPLFSVQTLIPNLTVRRAPDINAMAIRNAGLGTFQIYEESNGFGRISPLESAWIYIKNPAYTQKVSSDPVPQPTPDLEKRVTALEEWAKTKGFVKL